MVKIEDLIHWVEEGNGRRSIDIEIGKFNKVDNLRIYFYDYSLRAGESVYSLDDFNLDDINLAKSKEQEELKKYEELKNKYAMEASKC